MAEAVVEHVHGLTHIALSGRLDSPGVDTVEPRFLEALAVGAGGPVEPGADVHAAVAHGVVDLSGVTFLSSLGVRMLVAGAMRLDRDGARLVLVAPSELVAEALEHAAIDEIVPIAADLDAARALLGGAAEQ